MSNTIPQWFSAYSVTQEFADGIWKMIKPRWLAEEFAVTGVKPEATGLNIAGNLAKIEGNVFTLQADAFRVDAAIRDWVFNRVETTRALDELRASRIVNSQATRESIKELIDPVTLRKNIHTMQEQLNVQVSELSDLRKAMDPNLRQDVRRLINDMSQDTLNRIQDAVKSATDRAKALTQELNQSLDPRIDALESRARTASEKQGEHSTNLRTLKDQAKELQDREKDLREAVVQLSRILRGANPDAQNFEKQLKEIRRGLT
ncbi:hypothetical protein ACFS5L_32215 [Streptomyces phyllanthi]|uniref:Uncharacterized protein n=1 Tax=Streptomyces phyllanthi TaxID=1803180 RepID=A0A5N8WFA4_9ACTN|nr:hypothetical protein [Streptomyces phyllanthi]MPY46160.1 hypothetical protein [Streptomyces phyllanthi]